MSISAKVVSPCTEVCTLDASGQVCIGCGRTTDEIAGWPRFTDAERARVIAELPGRPKGDGSPARSSRQACPKCGAQFGCGAGDDTRNCWCTSYPPVKPVAGQSCLCPACLATA
jgi:predicted Fe-S protein YdhL (DUF1289 family)